MSDYDRKLFRTADRGKISWSQELEKLLDVIFGLWIPTGWRELGIWAAIIFGLSLVALFISIVSALEKLI